MKSRNLLGMVFLSLSAVLFAVFITTPRKVIVQIFRPQEEVVNKIPENDSVTGLPAFLIIPKLKIHANIQNVGINIKGEMESPNSEKNVGWYNQGPVPGNEGSAVIAGHTNSREGGPGIFSNLDQLAVGENIFVVDQFGSMQEFVVDRKEYINPGHADEVFSGSGRRLNLVTCIGSWNILSNTFSKRLVVFAKSSETGQRR